MEIRPPKWMYARPLLWSALRAMGNSSAVKSAVVVPLLGPFLLFNDQIITWLRAHPNLCGGCAVSWRLESLYFGGWAFTLAAIIYAFRCPAMVKKYEDGTDYAAGERDSMRAHVNGYFRDALIEARHDPKTAECLEKSSNVLTGPRMVYIRDSPAMADERGRINEARALVSYTFLDRCHPYARTWVFVLFVLGFSLIAIPSAWTAVEIMARIVRG